MTERVQRLTDAAERPARARRGRAQTDASVVDGEPAVSEVAAAAHSSDVAECADQHESADDVAAQPEVGPTLLQRVLVPAPARQLAAAPAFAHRSCLRLQLVDAAKACNTASLAAPSTCDADAAQEQVSARADFALRSFCVVAYRCSAPFQLLRQLSAAAAVPLPSPPVSAPAAAPAPVLAVPPVVAPRSPPSQGRTTPAESMVRCSRLRPPHCRFLLASLTCPASQAPPGAVPPVVKQSGKILALQAAELARKQEVRSCAAFHGPVHASSRTTAVYARSSASMTSARRRRRSLSASVKLRGASPCSSSRQCSRSLLCLRCRPSCRLRRALAPLRQRLAAGPPCPRCRLVCSRRCRCDRSAARGCAHRFSCFPWLGRRTSSSPRLTGARRKRSCFSPRKRSARRVTSLARALVLLCSR